MNDPIHDISEFEHALSLVKDDIRTRDFRAAMSVLDLLVKDLKALAIFSAGKNEFSVHLIESCNSSSDAIYNRRHAPGEGTERFIGALGAVYYLIESMQMSNFWQQRNIEDNIDSLMIDVEHADRKIKDAHSLLHSFEYVWAKAKGQKSKRKQKRKIVDAVTTTLSANINMTAKEVFACFDDGGDVFINDNGDICQDGEGGGSITFKTFENIVSQIKSKLRRQQ